MNKLAAISLGSVEVPYTVKNNFKQPRTYEEHTVNEKYIGSMVSEIFQYTQTDIVPITFI